MQNSSAWIAQADSGQQTAGSRQQSRQQTADSRQQASNIRQQTLNSRQQAAGIKQQKSLGKHAHAAAKVLQYPLQLGSRQCAQVCTVGNTSTAGHSSESMHVKKSIPWVKRACRGRHAWMHLGHGRRKFFPATWQITA
jgi:hypothetical protein